MAYTPTRENLEQLLSYGYTPQQIKLIVKSETSVRAALQAGQSRGMGSNKRVAPLPQSTGLVDGSSAVRQQFGPFSSRDIIGGTATIAPQPQSTSGNVGSTIAQTALGALSGLRNSSSLGNIARRVADIATKAGGAIGSGIRNEVLGSAGGSGQRVAGNRGINSAGALGSDESFDVGYSPEAFQAPNFEYRDFTDQARQQVGGVYSPRYAAIDEAANRANQQYKRSDTLTAGLYQKLADNIANIAAGSAARHANAAQEQTARTNQLVADTGQNYSSTQNQEARLLEQMGQQEAARDVLGNNSAEQAYQQSQVQREGALQQAANTSQANVQADYLGNVTDANNTQGVVARQNLIANLGDQLSGYEQDRFNLKGDEANAALQLGQQLSDRDFSLQQANYGGYRDAYGANNQNAQFQANLSLQQAQARQQQAQAVQEQQMRQQEINRNQANLDRQYQFDQAKYGTDLATALAQQRLAEQKVAGSGNEALSFDNSDPVSRTVQQISSATGGNSGAGQQYFDFVNQAANAAASNAADVPALIGSQGAFIEYIRGEAAKRGMDQQVAQAAAAAYWSNIYGQKK